MIKSRFVPRIAEFTRKASDEQILGTGLIVSGLATSAGALAIDAFVGNETLTSLVTVGGLGRRWRSTWD